MTDRLIPEVGVQLLLSRVLDLFLFTARLRDAGSQVLVVMVTVAVSDLLTCVSSLSTAVTKHNVT